MGRNARGHDEWAHLEDGLEVGGWARMLRSLSSIHEVFGAIVSAREFIHKGLRATYRAEFGRLCARVVSYNRMDAWNHLAHRKAGGALQTLLR